uniref:Uncharacterized protein n=1 Tax=Anguilla anguilla TaxID=7936 RepID=A0A0E9Q160_ANGAN
MKRSKLSAVFHFVNL